jgi:hypothetical protein
MPHQAYTTIRYHEHPLGWVSACADGFIRLVTVLVEILVHTPKIGFGKSAKERYLP